MDKSSAYFELQSIMENSTLDIPNGKLIEAMRITAVQGFGWPIGVVIDVEQYRPKAKDKAVEAVIKTDESFDNWTLTSSGNFYLLKTLFEEKRDRTAIYIDVRLVRLLEAFARIAALYRQLGATNSARVKLQFKYGGLTNRVLKIASGTRMPIVIPRASSIDSFTRVHDATLEELLRIDYLEQTVVRYGREFAQIFDSFDLNEDVAKQMLKEHPVYRGVTEILTRGAVR